MPTPRRRFLAWLGGSSLAGAAAPAFLHAAPGLLPPPAPARVPGPHPDPVADTFDMSWTARITGKYRAVFDSPEISEGAAMARTVSWVDFYKEVYGIERGDMSPVLVLRHAAIDLVMGDDYWARYGVGKANALRTPQGKKWAVANPISGQGAVDERMKKYTLVPFLASGGIVLACGWAFRKVVSRIEKADGLATAAARAKALELMIPGIILQPNGIFAALRAQEAGCHYVLAS